MVTKKGQVDPGHACSAVRRLLGVGIRAREAEVEAQQAYESFDPEIRKQTLGRVSALLSYIQADSKDAVEDWKYVHPQVVGELLAARQVDLTSATHMRAANV
jgi:hypothetical protein